MKNFTFERVQAVLADDDVDDRFFFEKALQDCSLPVDLKMLENGEELMKHLHKTKAPPDVLFLDLNMPRKNGAECLREIKDNVLLKKLPVIIYSTSLQEEVADVLHEQGAHFYIRKTDFPELKKILCGVVEMIVTQRLTRPDRKKFVLNTALLKHS
jgi:CheY-like chemotaxis protein